MKTEINKSYYIYIYITFIKLTRFRDSANFRKLIFLFEFNYCNYFLLIINLIPSINLHYFAKDCTIYLIILPIN